MENFLRKSHIVFLDNFYNSVDLTENLLNKQTKMTLQSHRAGNLKEEVEAKLKRVVEAMINRQKGGWHNRHEMTG